MNTDRAARIMEVVCAVSGATRQQLRGHGRCQTLVDARAVFIWLMHRHGASIAKAGRWLERDHTTAGYHVATYEARRLKRPALAEMERQCEWRLLGCSQDRDWLILGAA